MVTKLYNVLQTCKYHSNYIHNLYLYNNCDLLILSCILKINTVSAYIDRHLYTYKHTANGHYCLIQTIKLLKETLKQSALRKIQLH